MKRIQGRNDIILGSLVIKNLQQDKAAAVLWWERRGEICAREEVIVLSPHVHVHDQKNKGSSARSLPCAPFNLIPSWGSDNKAENDLNKANVFISLAPTAGRAVGMG